MLLLKKKNGFRAELEGRGWEEKDVRMTRRA